MRGKAHTAQRMRTGGTITPAYAGKSGPPLSLFVLSRDHPRTCGEKAAYLRAVWVPKGSPPHMRGKARDENGQDTARWDHPRTCGEKMVGFFVFIWKTGSPPHMRGKGIQRCGHANQRGITPAYAGKRKRASVLRCNQRDHPRVCGEKKYCPGCGTRLWGSPPRMRGKEEHPGYGKKLAGITPAYAGKSA